MVQKDGTRQEPVPNTCIVDDVLITSYGCTMAWEQDVIDLYKLWTGKDKLSSLVRFNEYLYVARHKDGYLAGAAMLIVLPDPLRDHLWGLVENVFVHPDFGRKDIGSRLMQFVEGEAESLGCKFIKLTSRKQSGQGLYRRMGYREGCSFYKSLEPNRKIVTVAVSGYFDPLHGGHLDHIEKAKGLGDRLVAIAGTEEQCDSKPSHHGKHFYSWEEKVMLLKRLGANEVVPNIDTDGTCANSLKLVKPNIFAKGEGYSAENIPENERIACEDIGCKIMFGVGRRLNESRKFWES